MELTRILSDESFLIKVVSALQGKVERRIPVAYLKDGQIISGPLTPTDEDIARSTDRSIDLSDGPSLGHEMTRAHLSSIAEYLDSKEDPSYWAFLQKLAIREVSEVLANLRVPTPLSENYGHSDLDGSTIVASTWDPFPLSKRPVSNGSTIKRPESYLSRLRPIDYLVLNILSQEPGIKGAYFIRGARKSGDKLEVKSLVLRQNCVIPEKDIIGIIKEEMRVHEDHKFIDDKNTDIYERDIMDIELNRL